MRRRFAPQLQGEQRNIPGKGTIYASEGMDGWMDK